MSDVKKALSTSTMDLSTQTSTQTITERERKVLNDQATLEEAISSLEKNAQSIETAIQLRQNKEQINKKEMVQDIEVENDLIRDR